MLQLEDFVKIRQLHFKDGWGIKKICRTFGYARQTVRKAVREEGGRGPQYHLSTPRPHPVCTPELVAYVREILVADKKMPRKQRHTAHRLFGRLCKEHPSWNIGESTLRGLVRRIRTELRERPLVTTPLAFEPGEETQVDFGEAYVVMKGEQIKVHLLIATLCYSRRCFVMGFPSPNQEAFLEGQVRAFRHFGGFTSRVAYDNPKVAVAKILRDGKSDKHETWQFRRGEEGEIEFNNGRSENRTFKAFRATYCFEPRFCTPGIEGAHEKGRVERRVRTFRSNEMVPLPEVSSWSELNEYLLAHCVALDGASHPVFRDRTVGEVFTEERTHLLALPRFDFVCADFTCCRVDGSSRVVYEQVHYSVPSEFGRREVEVRAFWDRVDFYNGTTLIASWPRSYKPGEEYYDYHHYLKLLRHAPGASLNGKPYSGLPDILLRYRKELLTRYERRHAGRCLAVVLSLLLEHPEKTVLDAVELAMLCGTVNADAVRALVNQLLHGPRVNVEKLDLSSRPSLPSVTVTRLDLSRYNTLMGASTA